MTPSSNTLVIALIITLQLAGSLLSAAQPPAPTVDQGVTAMRQSFLAPPAEARPWVYWFWLNSNVTHESLTADLEAMQRVGIGGVLIMDVDQGTPQGPVKFMDADWQELFGHTLQEAKRLGMEVNMNNGAGYCGSGGPWIKPDKAMQTVVVSESHLTGGTTWTGRLEIPGNRGAYRDIAVLAVAEPNIPPKERFKLANAEMKLLTWRGWNPYRGGVSAPLDAVAPANVSIPRNQVIDLSDRMGRDGSLTWEAPTGEWTLLRIGHAWSGARVFPAKSGGGPESDKLDKEALHLHFDAMVKPLASISRATDSDSLKTIHIDSWEGGGQNWTPSMRREFQTRRGYDPVPYLPVLAGRIIGDLQITERFLWDLRTTVSELMVDNYVAEFQKLCREAGLRFTFESYTTTGNDLDAANFVDEPMAEFWTNRNEFKVTIKSMASAAHVNGRIIVGAESLTSDQKERWLLHPAKLKADADTQFASGVNRMVIHCYAAQRFPNRFPGLQMGPWGVHYERTNTWWEWSKPWHDYLTRCQHLLRQGKPVADVLVVEPEEPLHRFSPTTLIGYDYDACSASLFLQTQVNDGRVVLPSGVSYRLLVMPKTETMTLARLAHLRKLAEDGASILGLPPKATPGLTGFPQADEDLRRMAAELWSDSMPIRSVGKGRIFSGVTPEAALAEMKIAPDLATDPSLKWIHRTAGDTEFYFIANGSEKSVQSRATFRVAGKQAEIWDAETGLTTPVSGAEPSPTGTTVIPLSMAPTGSLFVVFHPGVPNLKSVFAAETATPSVPKEPLSVSGPWTLSFPPNQGAPAQVSLEKLISWSDHPDTNVAYFSGTATYRTTLNLPASRLTGKWRLKLDLGAVEVMARVKLNGHDLGILWKPPYQVDITDHAKAGENALEIAVVNLWPNRLIGDEQLPEDSIRNVHGTIQEWPQWLLDGKPSPAGRITFCSWRTWKKDQKLLKSGLLGPVNVTSTAKP